MKIFHQFLLSSLLIITNLISSSASATTDTDPWHAKAATLFEHAVNIPTVAGRNQVPILARYLADQFLAAGIPANDIKIIPYNQTAALIVRWRVSGTSTKKPIMVMGHMDVVEAKKEDWSTDPFTLVKKDGYYYGRGTFDMKSGLIATTIALLKLKATGFHPDRDIILFYTGDEETSGIGAQLGATKWKKWLDVEYALNADSGVGGFTTSNQPIGFGLQTSEKTNAYYTFTVRNPGGHSSKPRPDNAIYQLANALRRLETYRFQPVLTDTTRAYFAAREKMETNTLGDAMRAWLKNPENGAAADVIEADPGEAGLTRTRCVATRLLAGHADNALPQLATATINCRIMPGVSPDIIKKELEKIVTDPGVVVTRNDNAVASLASPLRQDILNAYTQTVHAQFPTAPIIPIMSAGATDGRPFRVIGIPVYGVDGIWLIIPNDLRAHGRDERLSVQALADDVDHWVTMLTILTKNK